MSSIPKKTFMTGQTTLAYAYLTKPDTAFDSDGVYKTDFKMSADDAKPLLDEMRSIANEAFGKNASPHMPYKTDDETGEIVFKTKSKYQPRFVDASGKNVDAQRCRRCLVARLLASPATSRPMTGMTRAFRSAQCCPGHRTCEVADRRELRRCRGRFRGQ